MNNRLITVLAMVFLVSSKLYCPVWDPKASSSSPILVKEHYIEAGKAPLKIPQSEIGKVDRTQGENFISYSKYINENGWNLQATYFSESTSYTASFQDPRGNFVGVESNTEEGLFHQLENEWKRQNRIAAKE